MNRDSEIRYHLKLAISMLDTYENEEPESVPEVAEIELEPLDITVSEGTRYTTTSEGTIATAYVGSEKKKNKSLINELIWKKGRWVDDVYKKISDFAGLHMGYDWKNEEHKKMGIRKYINKNQDVLTLEKQKVLLAILEGTA
jgi:hypothetical protein